MDAIIIKADKKSNKILAELAKKLGGNVIDINAEQYEDFILGTMMDAAKTGKTVSRETIFKKLKAKWLLSLTSPLASPSKKLSIKKGSSAKAGEPFFMLNFLLPPNLHIKSTNQLINQ